MKMKLVAALMLSTLMVTGCGQNCCSKKEACATTKCCATTKTDSTKKCCGKTKNCKTKKTNCAMKQQKFQKKYTNADFYTDGKFNQDVAVKAVKEMLDFYGYPFTPFMEKNFWVADFGLGDFENTGMGGIFWVNNKEYSYMAHQIYLLPGQMIPEHKHVATDMPAKFESWMVERGSCYNFSEVGEETPNPPAIPATQKATTISKNFVVQNTGDVIDLKKICTFHFLLAGDEGAIVSEWATFHDGNGLRFTNTAAKL